MTLLIGILLFVILLLISGIHVYWAFGGRWGSQAVFPTKANNEPLTTPPGVGPMLVVAMGLLAMGGLLAQGRSDQCGSSSVA